jgi:hypothetical protein
VIKFKVGQFYRATIPAIFKHSKTVHVLFRLKKLTLHNGEEIQEIIYGGGNGVILYMDLLEEDVHEPTITDVLNAGFFQDIVEVQHISQGTRNEHHSSN